MLVGGGSCEVDWRAGESDWDGRQGEDGIERSGGGILTGNGNRGPLFFFRLGKRKKVVVVETV